ncbi:MAG: hypothetical protein ACE37F_02160 [Nannocystaceae bacterium]|nr:hypothetical protein [bacterium]
MAGLVCVGWVSIANAQPQAPAVVCETYPTMPACAGAVPDCTLCHQSAGVSVRNVFGAQVEAAAWPGEDAPTAEEFVAGLPDALAEVEDLDADDDGYANYEELLAGSDPADADDIPGGATCEDTSNSDAWQYDVCNPDAGFTLRKIMLDVCGHSPTLAELEEVTTSDDPSEILHETLDTCLNTEFWRGNGGVLWQLAHKKILPLPAIKSGANEGGVPLADYDDDYNLYVHASSDGNDARDLLLAQYVVGRVDGDTTEYYVMDEAEQAARPNDAVLNAPVERRAGMITSRWFFVANTMFTAVPRTTAAQAYRSYLGFDIAKLEGLIEPPASEVLIDYDNKDVLEETCAGCHRTLDPLAYPFTRYNGIGGAGGSGDYNANRLGGFVDNTQPDVDETPEAGYILGEPVSDLVEWAEVAANSDEFAAALVMDYWELLVGERPNALETEQFVTLWQDFATTHAYDVEAMLHDLIDTEAYSVP